MLEQASPVLLYHTQYTLYIMQPSTRVRCSEARLAVLQTVYYTVLYVTQPRTGVRCSEESVLQRCSVTELQCYSVTVKRDQQCYSRRHLGSVSGPRGGDHP